MSRQAIAILGAGAMGSALVTPLVDGGHDVRLWGTWLDDAIVAALRRGDVHPGTKAPVPPSGRVFASTELQQAMDGADIVLMAVTSEGLDPVFRRAASHLRAGQTVVTVAKGFFAEPDGQMVLLPTLLESLLPESLKATPIVAVGGPSKAVEVGLRAPTAVSYACRSLAEAQRIADLFATKFYFIEPSDDIVGLEICAALKNVYAIGLGICEGFRQGRGVPHNNTKSALFQVAVEEMALICEKAGGRASSSLGLPGVGDLEVTGEAGRNRVLGELIGGGLTADAAVLQMRERGQTVEGYPAAALGWQYCRQLGLTAAELPLFGALNAILYESADAFEHILEALSRRYPKH